MKHTRISARRVRQLSYHPLARAVSFAMGVMMASTAAPALAGPEDGQIVGGVGTITQGIDTTVINQSSQTLSIDWQSFNVAENESVRFDQPTTAAVAINRILDQNPSQIFGAIDANGHVYLLNPNGVVFGATARVDVGTLVASSLNLTRAENGSLDFAADGPAGLVVNRGLIRAATGGSVTLLGGAVANEGLIVADLGKVNLGAGARASLDFDGDGMLFFEVDGDLLSNDSGATAAVSNTGTIEANGGQVLLSARAAQGVFSNVVNNEGLVRAARIDNTGGVVRLVGSGAPVIQAGTIDVSAGDAVSSGGSIDVLGGDVNVTAGAQLRADGATDGGSIRVLADQTARAYGDFSARGGAAGGDGGFIETSGRNVDIGGTFNASAVNGAAGKWLLDPTNILVDAALAATTVATLDGGTDVTITTALGGGDAGDITVAAPIARTGATNQILTLNADNDITVDQPITSADGTLDVILRADRNVTINANIDANGGNIEASVDVDEATTNDPSTLTIGTGAGLTGATIAFNSSILGVVQDDTLVVLRGAGDTAAWAIDGVLGANTGTVAATGFSTTASFNQFSSLTGGDQGDTFTFSGVNGTIAGTASGAGNNDDFVVDNGTGATAYNGGAGASDDLTFAGSAGPVTISSGAVTAIELVTGSASGEDVLQGTSGDDTFTTTDADEVTFGGVVFASFENLAGLAGDDTFNLNDDLTGTTGVDGGDDSDTIVAGAAAVFAIDASNGGSLTSGGNTIPFSNVENLTGSGVADTFTFTAAGAIQGTASGLGGNDTFEVDNGNGAAAGTFDGGTGANDEVTFANYGGGPATIAISRLANIDDLTGSADTGDVLQGTAVADTFTMTGADAGTHVASGVDFTSFENLDGLAGVDTFNLDANVSGGVDGGDDNDIFNLNADVTGTLDGGAGDDTFNLTNGFSATVDGGDDDDVIVADTGQPTSFEITSPGTGESDDGNGGVVTFSDIEDLTGSNQNDTFTFSNTGSLTGTISGLDGDDDVFTNNFIPDFVGGNGTDRVNLGPSGGGTPFVINAADYVGRFELFEGSPNPEDVVQGTGGNDTFGTSAEDRITFGGVTFPFFENVRGLGGNDTFNLNHNLTGTEGANGGDGTDTFNVAAGVTATIRGGLNFDSFVAVGGNDRQFAITSLDGGTVTNAGGTVTFIDVENLTGNTGNDTFTFTGAGAALRGTAAGDDGDDDFLVNNANGAAAATFDGGDGASDDLNFAGSNALGAVTVAMSGVTDIETITGTTNSDTLQGTSSDDTFATTAATNGTVNTTTTFLGFENLQGGDGNDTFDLNHGLTSVAGGNNNDVFNIGDGGLAVAVTGGDGSDSLRYTAATGQVTIAVQTLIDNSIEDVRGSNTSGQDTLQGTTGDDTFTTSAQNAGSIVGPGITFSSFENLLGDAGNDTFNVDHNITGTTGVNGQGGNDIVNLGTGAVAVVKGGLDTDSLRYTSQSGPRTIKVEDVLADEFEDVHGSSGADTLQGTAGADTFATTGANQGTVNGGTPSAVTFQSFENLEGLAGNDTFDLNHALASADGGADNDVFNIDDGALNVVVRGGTETDSLRYCCATGPVTVAVGTLNTRSIEDVVGSGSGQDVLQGTANADTFVTTAADQGTVNAGTPGAITFSSFENLEGAAGDDVFDLGHNITGTAGVDGGADNDIFNLATGVTASVRGGLGADSLRYSAATGPITISIGALNAGSIEDVRGSSSGDDTLQGTADPDTFATTGANQGTVNNGTPTAVTFSSFENLQGAGGNDTFNLDHDISGTTGVNGGTENDTFNLGAGVSTTIAGGGNTDTIVAAAGQATGFAITGSDSGTITNGAGTVGFSDVANLTGGSQADTFTFSGDGGLTGAAAGGDGGDQFIVNNNNVATTLNGGSGNDTLTYAGSTGPVTFVMDSVVSLIESVIGSASTLDILRGTAAADTFTTASTTSVTSNSVTFTGFETVDGAAGADVFNVGHNLGTGVTLVGGDDADTFNLTGAGSAALSGGAGADRFVLSDSAQANGVLDGGSEADVLDFSAYATGRTVNVTGLGTVDGVNGTASGTVSSFQNIDAIQGSTNGADTLRGANASSTWTVAGNSGTYATGGHSPALAFTSFATLEGGSGVDTFGLNAGTATGNLTISDGGGADTLNVAGAVNVTGDLTITNIETVTDTSGNRVTAGTLRITGASGGVGTTNQALLTNVNNLEITGGTNVTVTEQNGLTVSTIDAGSGAVRVNVTVGDLILGFVKGGNVRLDALDGDILSTAAFGSTNIQGNPVALVTPLGTSGSEAHPIVINAPTSGQILIESLDPATISNPNLATVIATRSSVIDVTVNQGIDLGTLGSSISRQEVAAIDWAGLDPNIALVDCLQPCIRLPADQSEEPGLVELREATKFLLIRTRDGWKMIPVVVREEVVAAN